MAAPRGRDGGGGHPIVGTTSREARASRPGATEQRWSGARTARERCASTTLEQGARAPPKPGDRAAPERATSRALRDQTWATYIRLPRCHPRLATQICCEPVSGLARLCAPPPQPTGSPNPDEVAATHDIHAGNGIAEVHAVARTLATYSCAGLHAAALHRVAAATHAVTASHGPPATTGFSQPMGPPQPMRSPEATPQTSHKSLGCRGPCGRQSPWICRRLWSRRRLWGRSLPVMARRSLWGRRVAGPTRRLLPRACAHTWRHDETVAHSNTEQIHCIPPNLQAFKAKTRHCPLLRLCM